MGAERVAARNIPGTSAPEMLRKLVAKGILALVKFLRKAGRSCYGSEQKQVPGAPMMINLSLTPSLVPIAPAKALRRRLLTGGLSVLVLLLVTSGGRGQTTLLGTQALTLNLQPAGLLYSVPATVTLTHVGTIFAAYTGAVTLQYRARTSASGGGTITAQATTDFPCASGGPCIATPPTAGDALSYTCSGATLGSNCSGSQTTSTTAATNVVTIPASACTGAGSPCNNAATNTVTVSFTLTNDPKYKTGTYNATLTWTISTT